MVIRITKTHLLFKDLTPVQEMHLFESAENLEISGEKHSYIVKGSYKDLYMLLFTLSFRFDIEIV